MKFVCDTQVTVTSPPSDFRLLLFHGDTLSAIQVDVLNLFGK
jgi:hypothetical protein